MLTIAELASESYVAPRTKEELMRDYKRLAKSADARLRKLEKNETRKGFEAITKYAYARAMKDIGRGEGGRFDVSMRNKTYNEILGAMNDVRKFYRSESSTITGVRNIYIRNAEKFNQKYNTSFTWQQLAQLFNKDTGLFEKVTNKDSQLGSQRIVRAIAIMQNNASKLVQAINTNTQIDIVDADKPALQTMNDIISKYPNDVKELLKM